jgi:hypothetical protein
MLFIEMMNVQIVTVSTTKPTVNLLGKENGSIGSYIVKHFSFFPIVFISIVEQ